MNELWREDVWMGLRIWRCGLCPWDTLDGEERMREHVWERHGEGDDRGPRTEDGNMVMEDDEFLGEAQDIDLEDFIFEEVGDAKDEFDAEDGAG